MTYRVPFDIAWVVHQPENRPPLLYLMQVPDGAPLVLTDTAALIWLFATQGDDVVAALRAVVKDPPADLAQMTTAYLADLLERGLLTETESGCGLVR